LPLVLINWVVEIKNIIFDLGGVILNLGPEMAASEFSKACGMTEKELHDVIIRNRGLFIDYETGMIDSSSFRGKLCEIISHEMHEDDFDRAWNSILFDVPEDRVRVLEQLKSKYRLFMFSNTNAIHEKRINKLLNLSLVFEKIYFSHLIHKRKPDLEAFMHIINENNLDPAETLFIDDSVENTEGAKKAGMHVLHVERNNPQLEVLIDL
jgi:glucose-1-phosphatase